MKNTINTMFYAAAFGALNLFFLTNFVIAKETLPDPITAQGAKTKAMGSAAVSMPGGYSSLIVNPGAAAFDEDYVLGLGYLGAGRTIQASLVDNKSSFVGGGLYYNRRDTKKGDIKSTSAGTFRRTEDRVGLSFFGKASDMVGVGAGAKWARRKGSTAVSEESNMNGDIGALVKIEGNFRLGASVLNVFDDEKGLHPRSIHVGASQTTLNAITLSVELSFIEKPGEDSQFVLPADERLSWGVGGEYRYKTFSFKTGFHDSRPWDQKWLTAGLGVRADKFELDYAFEGLVSGQGESLHSATLSVYF